MVSIAIAAFLIVIGNGITSMIMMVPIVVMHMVLSYFFNAAYGLNGLAMATNITYFISMISLLSFTIVSKDQRLQSCLPPFSFPANLINFGTYSSLGLISLIWSLNDYMGPMSMNLLTGVLGVDYQASYLLATLLTLPLYVWPLACSFAISALIGQSIGKARVDQAKRIT
jgi:Na+-driven multidrug efflux pump